MESDSTVEGTKKLEEVYNKFEKRLGTRHKDLWTPNEPESSTETPYAVLNEEINLNQSTQISVEKIRKWEHNFKLTRHQRAKSSMIAKKLLDSAEKQELSLSEYINKKQPSVPNFSLRKLQKVLDGGDAEDSDLEEGELDQAGELINMIRKNKAHKDRLHDELWYNEPGHANDGLLCRCSEHAKSKGIRHNIYPGEEKLPSCHPLKNNIGKLYHYRVTVGPAVNFMIATPTTIEHNGQDYYFEGFSMFSHEPLDKIPLCDIIRFHIRYTIYLIEETPPENFCMRGLDLFHDYLFREILELYDWESRDPRFEISTESENSRKFRFFPRFVRSLPDNGKEILSLSKVLEYLQENDQPLVDDDELDQLMRCSHDDWLKYAEKVRGMIVTYPGKKPSSLRVDQLDRYDRVPVESKSDQNHPVDERYPMIVHFGIRPANLSYAGDPQYQRIWRAYLKLRHLMANSPNVKPADKKKLRERQDALQKIRRAKDMQREVTVELSSKGFRRTGIYSDVCQHALLLPVLTHHLRYHLCLKSLERSIGYHFKERKWLSHAMNHPSCHMNFGLNPDHVRNALSNCGLRLPRYGDSSIHYKYTRKRGITTLIRIMARLGQHRPVLSPIEHNERLEFLGDAVVGYFTSVHLFLMFPDLSEGALTTFRTVLVNNQHLATLAERLRLDEYMLYAHGPDLCRKADLRHAMANCFEALMGAIYMEGGLETAKKLFGEFLWETPKLRSVWRDLPLHPLQEEKPGTDRPCIKDVPILQKLTKFEDAIGVEFNHIRILAKAFTWRNVYENILTRGHNQRLEFLGDSICNLVASTYLFRRYPTHHEGHLTLLRATIVNGRTQSLVATELGMPEYVICNLDGENSGGKAPEWREKNLADLLEAFVAALFVDKGLKYVEGFMQVCFFPRLKEFILTQEWNDPKSCLQQCCLTLRQEGKEPQLPTYDISHQTGPSHARKYVVSVYFKGEAIGTGTGESIQKAERNAARTALQEYNFPQLEWQRRYVAEKHDLPYAPRKNLKKIEPKRDESSQPAAKTAKLDSKPVTSD
uniref:Ribonuclease 3 n=1 Tax=Phallusia mammillata TaxID=59560 RepID=A0A6F9DCA7_9ASCI|nr:ribonuclease 3 [Phallusia mammillata]